MHIGVFHIAMNMIGLWQIGRLVERLLGNLGFAVTYVLAGLAGSVLSTFSHPFTVSAGASGAIFGVYGALIAYIIRHRGLIPTDVLRPLQKTAVAFVGLNIIFGLRQKGIDMAAHFGGLGGGAIAGFFVGRPLGENPAVARGRAILVGVMGLLLLGVAVQRLPRAVDLSEEIATFQTVEKTAVAAYNDGIERIAQGHLADEDVARIIDEQVLPPWRAFQRRLVPYQKLAPAQQALGRELGTYVAARERAWTQISAALSRHDRAAIDAANRELHQSLDALVILNGKSEPSGDNLTGDGPDGRRP
jgi:rhomboid protease GluP